MKNQMLKDISKLVIPFIQIFGVYVILNGHISPGGGFAGGTIFGASFILMRIAYGNEYVESKLNYRKMLKVMCSSLLIYGVLKGYSFLSGGLHLDLPSPPLGEPGKIFSAGYILPLNICVGTTVSITMYFLYSLFWEGEI